MGRPYGRPTGVRNAPIGGRVTVLDGLDVDGALTAAALVLLLLVGDGLPLGQVVVGRAACDTGSVEEDLAAVLGLDKAEATVANETDD